MPKLTCAINRDSIVRETMIIGKEEGTVEDPGRADQIQEGNEADLAAAGGTGVDPKARREGGAPEYSWVIFH